MSATTVAPPSTAFTRAERHPLRWAILAIVLVAEVMDLLDGTIVNVAAPSIRRDLGGSATTLQWLGAAYTLAFAVLLVTGARLGDLFGLGWRSVFLVNVPLGIVGLVGSWRVMPRTGGRAGTRLDPGGALLATAAAVALVYPLVQGRELGWPAWIFALIGVGIGGFAAFALYERRHAERALIAPSLLRNGAFTSGLVVALCFFAAMIGLNLVLSLFCQLGEGFSPLRTGLTLAPFALGIALTAGPSYPLAQRFGRVSMQAGFAVMAAGLVVLAAMVHGAGDDVSSWTLVPGELVAGMGMGLALPPLFDFILAGVQEHEVGSASGVLNAVQQFAGALGIAIFATVFFAFADGGHTPVSSVSDTALLSIVPLVLAILAVFRLPHHAREQAVA